MMLRKKLTILFLIVALICPMVFSAGSVQAASKVRLNKTKITLVVGQKKKLKVKGTKKKVKWSSNKKSVVSVSKKGVIKAKKKGKAVITARVGKKKLKCKVTVKKKKSALSKTSTSKKSQTENTTNEAVAENSETAGSKALVVYFSATGNTKSVAGYIADAANADTFEIIPKEPYSDDDLDWTNEESRVSREHDNTDLRNVELTSTTVENWEDYKTVFIGYPIWWGIAAWPVNGFITANDFTEKTVIPFCTSSSSGIGESGELLAKEAGTGNWLEGERFQSGASEDDVKKWVESLDLKFVYDEDSSIQKSSQNSSELSSESEDTENSTNNLGFVTKGKDKHQGFTIDNIYHSPNDGDIHYNVYIPKSYDGSRPFALYFTLPGYEGLYFQGVAQNLKSEAFGFEAQKYIENMIIVAPQLSDWGETSADQTIALVEYFLASYNIDSTKVYANGYSGGGETMSIVLGKHPELFTAYLHCSSQWDGDLDVLVQSRTPVYLAVGQEDEYYGSEPTKQTYDSLH